MQHHGWLSRTKRILLNDTGQMTVFVALIFQVLFVFFAMVINIGLIVHDKINLQNAVDLAAYYGAERQAEILNEIAHVNYQIRQDYKLLTWRYRVLGTLGRGDNPGTTSPPPAMSSGTTYSFDEPRPEIYPSICVANEHWKEALDKTDRLENYCYQPYNGSPIPKIITLPVIAPFVPGVTEASATTAALRDTQNVTFMKSGQWNWAFAAQIMGAYKLSIANRKAIIQALRKNLVSSNMLDQNSKSVSDGVLTTIKKNLTLSNAASLEAESFQFINGLADPKCAEGDGSKTIVEIKTAPTLLFTKPLDQSGYLIGEASIDDTSAVQDMDMSMLDSSQINILTGFTKESSGDLTTTDGLTASSLGFEKNPWCMSYVGVHLKTHPRKPFAPFGKPVTLEARAFAQPFGGRIGPWYLSTWSANSDQSDGGNRVDPRTTIRYVNNQAINNPSDRLPNYSKYPGDPVGLESKAAQAAERLLMTAYDKSKGVLLSFTFFDGYGDIPQTGDPLAFASKTGPSNDYVNVRKAETIAVAPDAFDITYYSIDSHYDANYKALAASRTLFADLPTILGTKIRVAPDIGGRNGGDALLQNFNVDKQIQFGQTDRDPALKDGLPFVVLKADWLLTGWAPNSAQDFSFPAKRFVKCDGPAAATLMIPGGCAQGGRTGYSVRLLALDHLLSKKWAIGGDGAAVGGIRNPPPDGF